MFSQTQAARDAYTLSLGGMTAITSFVAAPVVAADRINAASDARVKVMRVRSSRASRRWQHANRPPAYWCCA
ncbi:MAG: hypothetical protein WBN44_08045 [Woeseiaceae bacterium]